MTNQCVNLETRLDAGMKIQESQWRLALGRGRGNVPASRNGKKRSQSIVPSPRVFAYCHDGVGLGHLRRTLNICEHVSRSFGKASFLIATGNPYVSLFERKPCIEFLKLPSLMKMDNDCYLPKFLDLDPSEVMHCRETLIQESIRHFAPHIVLIDKAPVGVCGELVSTLRWLRANLPNTRIVFGMRDIEDQAEVTIYQWRKLGAQTMLEDYFDEIWVYGMQNVFDVVSEYCLSDKIKSKLRFMGYVARPKCRHLYTSGHVSSNGKGSLSNFSSSQRRQVLVTVGGGTDGFEVLECYLKKAAQRVSDMGATSVIVAGPDFPAESAIRLKEIAKQIPHVEWLDYVSCMNCRIRRADLVVCMGGYNTLCEVVSNGKKPLVLPRIHPRLEQAIRADRWAERGLVDVLSPKEMQPEKLAERVVELLGRGRKSFSCDLDLSGLQSVQQRFSALLDGVVENEASVSL